MCKLLYTCRKLHAGTLLAAVHGPKCQGLLEPFPPAFIHSELQSHTDSANTHR